MAAWLQQQQQQQQQQPVVLVLALLLLAVRLVGSQRQQEEEPPRPGNLTECMNWYEGQCSTCRCSTLFAMGYTCESFAPGTEFQACEQQRSESACLLVSRPCLPYPQ